jgi:pimeloyl-ACP methyl ester carboxylesterase
MRRRTLLCVCLTVLLSSFLVARAQPAPAYQTAPCPFDVTQFTLQIECGLLTVPQNHASPQGESLVLAVVRVISPNPDSQPDPMVYLAGGPGESAVAGLLPFLETETGQQLLMERDWITVDQRGTGYSVPRLECNLFGLTRLSDPQALADAAQVCAARYRGAGIDVSAYNTHESAADLAALRTAMGYDTWNLYGVSYGTQLALTMVREYPTGIRSLVLDSISVPEQSVILADARYKAEFFQQIMNACAADSTCNADHPNLESRFGEAIADWNANPRGIGDLAITGDFLLFILSNTSFVTADLIPQLPVIFEMIITDDIDQLLPLFSAVITATDELDRPVYETDSVVANDGMGLFVMCNDAAGFTTDSDFDALRESLPAYTHGLIQGAQAFRAACSAAGLEGVEDTAPAVVERGTPALLLTGEYDPGTPVASAQLAANSLPQAQPRVVADVGHAVLFGDAGFCVAQTINAFVTDPDATVVSPCMIAK